MFFGAPGKRTMIVAHKASPSEQSHHLLLSGSGIKASNRDLRDMFEAESLELRGNDGREVKVMVVVDALFAFLREKWLSYIWEYLFLQVSE